MCGIAGIIYASTEAQVEASLLTSMTSSISHRGPDDSGIYVNKNAGLGHRRLSIIDLAGGHQPMSNTGAGLHIVFNGEIYNYKELRSELEKLGHIFHTAGDTEVILACYQAYGEGCVSKLNGMFAFGIWDDRLQKLFLARDRLGKKPLYYYVDQEKIIFASEIKAIFKHSGLNKSINLRAIDEYFSYSYIPEPSTIFEHIKIVPAAHTLIYTSGHLNLSRYWNVPYRDEMSKSQVDYEQEIFEILNDSVRIRMISDVPIGVFLSGGIDSSAITGLMARHSSGPVKTFSIRGGDGEFNELPYARAVAKYYSTDHHELTVEPEKLQDILPRLVKQFDQPFGDSSMLPTYYVSKLARQNVTVALSGEGGDELFAGYDWHKKLRFISGYKNYLPQFMRKALYESFLPSSLAPNTHKSNLKHILNRLSLANRLSLNTNGGIYEALLTSHSEHFKDLLYSDDFKNILVNDGETLKGRISTEFNDRAAGTVLERALITDIKLALPSDLLTKVDRMSMLNSLEVRSPILDYRLVELAARIPDDLKLHGKVSKYIFKRSVDGVLPPEISNRKTKRGFSVPVADWFRTEAFEYAQSVLIEGKLKSCRLFNGAAIKNILNIHKSGLRNYGPQIWSLLIFALWLEEYGEEL